MIGLACVLGLGRAGCKAAQVSETDASRTKDSSTPDPGASGYTFVFIRDVESQQFSFSCSATNAPGTDIDAVALIRKGQVIGYLMKGSAAFTPETVACAPADCSGGDCTYASSSSPTKEAQLIPRTEGPPDAVVRGSTNDTGYMSLNGGSLQAQFGDGSGNPPAQVILSGDQIKVYEVDQSYKTASNTGECTPEHYQLVIQTSDNQNLSLHPVQFDPLNSATCPSPDDYLGCGTTVFAVP
jgi:hypothetical protein